MIMHDTDMHDTDMHDTDMHDTDMHEQYCIPALNYVYTQTRPCNWWLI